MCAGIDGAERDAWRGGWRYVECLRTCAASLRGLNGPEGGSKGGNTCFFGCAIFEEVEGA